MSAPSATSPEVEQPPSGDSTAPPKRAQMLISKTWAQWALLVLLFGFFVMGYLVVRTGSEAPPVPERVVDPAGEMVFTGDDIREGQEIFLTRGLMEYGSVFGHGGYLGPDFTADYLRRSAEAVDAEYRASGIQDPGARTIDDFRTNRFDAESDTLALTAAQVKAFGQLQQHYADFFAQDSSETGLPSQFITDEKQIRQLTSFFAWTSWAAATERPGKDHTYTNNWPEEPLVANKPTASNILWSNLSLIALLVGIGALFAAFGRYRTIGWHGRESAVVSFRQPNQVALTPAQRVTAWFFFAMAGMFLVQTLVGAAAQHYRADRASFFGFDLAQILPFNVVRTAHVQLSILWVVTSFLAAGIFMAPMITRREPKGQSKLSWALFGALVIVVVGSLVGELSGIQGWVDNVWLANQGFEYLDLGRLWQVLLIIGLTFWFVILVRGLRSRLRHENKGNMPWLFVFTGLAIPAGYAVSLLVQTQSNFTETEFWRFWVVHLWVEDFLELFTTIMVAYIFVLLGVVSEKTALRVVYLDVILYSAGGIIGTMHHLYFSGEPSEAMALGAFFSALEVVPLTFLTVEAWTFLRLGSQQKSRSTFPHRWAIMFLVAVGFWNFVGAGVFGFLVNLPIVSYYEIGTALTANHAHAAMMGVYGMLAVGLALFGLRYIIPEERWSDRAAKISFWSLNIGLAMMVFATLLPLGVLQLYESVANGYFEARSLEFLSGPTMSLLEWLRLPGDTLFIGGGVLPLLYITWQGVRHGRKATGLEMPDDHLYTEVENLEESAELTGASAADNTGAGRVS